MLGRAPEMSTPKLFREDGSQNVAAARDSSMTELLRKQAVDMELFWEKHVKEDRRLLSILCSEFKQHTVETLLWVPYGYPKPFKKEVVWDSYFSSLVGFDAYSVIYQARLQVREPPYWPKPTWPKDVEECLERFIPAARLAEVVAWFAPFTVEDLFAMDDAVILQLLILHGDGLTFHQRFLFRYLQAARQYHCFGSQYTDEQRAIFRSAWKKRMAALAFQESIAMKLARVPQPEDDPAGAYRGLKKWLKIRREKYHGLPWHDVDVSDTVSGLL